MDAVGIKDSRIEEWENDEQEEASALTDSDLQP